MKKLIKKIKNNQKGFTLVELIVVVAILGVLAAVALPNYTNYLYKSRIETDVATAQEIIRGARTMMIAGTKAVDLTIADVIEELDMNATPASGPDDLESFALDYIEGTDKFEITFIATQEKVGKYGYNGSKNIVVTENDPAPEITKGDKAE